MATKRKNAKGEYVISIQSLGFNTTYSTRTGKLADANRIERAIEARIDQVSTDGTHDWHNWTKRQQLRWIKTGLAPTAGNEPLKLYEAIESYMDHCRVRGKAPSTISSYNSHLDDAKKFFGDIALCDLSARVIQDWADCQSRTIIVTGRNIGSRLDPKTIKKKVSQLLSVVNHFYKLQEPNLHPEAFGSVTYAVRPARVTDKLERWVDIDSRRIELVRLGIDECVEGAFDNVIYSRDQLDKHLKEMGQSLFVDGTVRSIQTYCAILVCCATGARRAELTRIRRADLLLDDELPMVTLTKLKGRGNLPYLRQKMPLPFKAIAPLRKLLKILPESQQSLFCSSDSHLLPEGCDEKKVFQEKVNTLTDWLNGALKGSEYEHASGWHIYRHTLASQLLMAGHSEMEVMNLIGWCSKEMAMKYQHATHAHKAAIINGIFA